MVPKAEGEFKYQTAENTPNFPIIIYLEDNS